MREISAEAIKKNFNIAIVVSQFNQAITEPLYQGAIDQLRQYEFSEEQITGIWVPGAVEIPLAVDHFAATGRYEAIVALGAVIRGETTHYDYVCQQVSYGCQQVALNQHIPVIFGVLTTETQEQAQQRIGGEHGHKGRDAIDSAIDMVSILRQATYLT